MRTSWSRVSSQASLLLLMILASLLPGATRAQRAQPSTTPTSSPQAQSDRHSYAALAVVDKTANVTTLEARIPAASSSSTGGDQLPGHTLPAARPLALPNARPLTVPLAGDPVVAGIRPAGVQGIVGLDVSMPVTIHAGEYITYTYTYTNTGTTNVTNAIVEARWANFGTSPTAVPTIWQFCPAAPDAPAGCVILPDSVQGPQITANVPCPSRPDISGTRFCFAVGTLGPTRNGQFKIRLRSNLNSYPKTGQPITRPAGSGILYLNGSNNSTSEDTANTLVTGPVIVLTKTVPSGLVVYPGENVDFTIRVGNATGIGDSSNGQPRVDAEPGRNLVVKDNFPTNSQFVSATGASPQCPGCSYSVDQVGKKVTWNVPGPINPGQVVEFHVVFRKVDVNSFDATRLTNSSYTVSSTAIRSPIITGPPVTVPVVCPLTVTSIQAIPATIPYGGETTLTIVVQNYWNQPISSAQLNYEIQSNASYIPDSASPSPTHTPSGSEPGGRVDWTFVPASGSKTAPTETTFSLRLRGGYASQPRPGTGRAWITTPAGIPSVCSQRDGKVTLNPRLRLTKTTDADPTTKVGDTYFVERAQQFSYTIEIINSGPTPANGVVVADALPDETGANFSYVIGSATLDNQAREPDSHVDGLGGSIIWNNLTIPAGGTIHIHYALRVDGRDYWKYCNTASATSGSETISYGQHSLCVKINPQIEVNKTADRACAAPGQEVRFTLTLTNHEPETYRVGLYDLLGDVYASSRLEFVRQESGYAAPSPIADRNGKTVALEWPLVDLGPGHQIAATIVARMPADGAHKDYINEGLFHNATDVVERIPRMTVAIHAACIEYSISSDRTMVSLQDRLVYTLQFKNASVALASNVEAVDTLPQGFTYLGLDATSDIKIEPLRSGSTLRWPIASIPASATVKIKFVARAGAVVGTYDDWLQVPTGGTCVASSASTGRGCQHRPDGSEYGYQSVGVQALITTEPKISPGTCALPNQTRTYRLSIVNTNNHDYVDTAVTLILPFGLLYVRSLDGTPEPAVATTDAGATRLHWSGLRVPAKPANVFAGQVVLAVELQVGQVFGGLDTVVETTSLDGSTTITIPRKDGSFDPSVLTCLSGKPVLAKEADTHIVAVGEEVLYQITLVNPTNHLLTATVEDPLPGAFTFSDMQSGPKPQIKGQTLNWANVTLPAAVSGTPGRTILRFKARLTSGVPGTSYKNTARIAASSALFDTTYSGVSVLAAREVAHVYLPLLGQ